MHKARMRGAHIAVELKMPPSTVYIVLHNCRLRGRVVPLKSPRRPRKLTYHNMRHLKRMLDDDRCLPLMEITNKMTDIAKVSCRIVRNALNDLPYRNRVAAKKPFLSEKHKAQRLVFARQYRDWTVEDWKVIWTDESCFEIGKNSRQIRVWRKSCEICREMFGTYFQLKPHFSNGLGCL